MSARHISHEPHNTAEGNYPYDSSEPERTAQPLMSRCPHRTAAPLLPV